MHLCKKKKNAPPPILLFFISFVSVTVGAWLNGEGEKLSKKLISYVDTIKIQSI